MSVSEASAMYARRAKLMFRFLRRVVEDTANDLDTMRKSLKPRLVIDEEVVYLDSPLATHALGSDETIDFIEAEMRKLVGAIRIMAAKGEPRAQRIVHTIDSGEPLDAWLEA